MERDRLISEEQQASLASHSFENPLEPTPLDDKSKVSKFKSSSYLYTKTVIPHTDMGKNMVITKCNNFEMQRPKKVMQPIDGQISVTQDLLGDLGKSTPYELMDNLREDHQPPSYKETCKNLEKRHVSVGNFK